MSYKNGIYVIRLEHSNAENYNGPLLVSQLTGARYYLSGSASSWIPNYNWELASKWYVDNALTASVTGYSGYWNRIKKIPYGFQLVSTTPTDYISIGSDYFDGAYKLMVTGNASLSGNVLINNTLKINESVTAQTIDLTNNKISFSNQPLIYENGNELIFSNDYMSDAILVLKSWNDNTTVILNENNVNVNQDIIAQNKIAIGVNDSPTQGLTLSGNITATGNITANRHYVYSSLTSLWIPNYNWELTTKYYVDSITSSVITERFTNLTPVPVTLGGVTAGSTFNNASVTSVLDTLLYPYITQAMTLSINSNICEMGYDPTVILSWSIIKHSNNIISASMPNSDFNPTLPITSSTAGYSSGYWLMNTDRTWELTSNDNITSVTVKTNLYFRYPYFYGMSASDFTGGGSDLYTGLTKLVDFYGNKTLLLNGTNQYIYFCFDANYSNLSSILDNNGFEVIAAFTKYEDVSVDTPNPKTGWPTKYTVYRSTNLTNVNNAYFQFKY